MPRRRPMLLVADRPGAWAWLQNPSSLTARIPALANSYKFLPPRYRGYIMGLHRAPYPASIVEPPPMRGCETRDEVSDERFRSAARGGNPAAAPLCARPDPGCVPRRRSRPELPDPRGRQTASLAARHRLARLAFHDPA